ncbi:Larval serum protein 1 alpha chain [Sergentomyia squamirostris]
MKALALVFFACAIALSSGYYMVKDVKYADKDFLYKQKAILEVLQHVHQHEVHTQLWEDSKTYVVSEHFNDYTNVTAVKEFWMYYEYGMLPFDDVFSVFSETHKKQVMSLFYFFYYAKDWDTFYKSMVWARFHVNEGMFVYALTTAVLHRKDLAGIVLPAPYEIYPYYFFNSEVITTAQQYKMQGFYGMKKYGDVYSVTIPSNYTGWYKHTNPEQKISYFTEDIGLNSHYYYFHMDYPFWMGGKEFNLYSDRRGEYYFYQYQQYLARYYLERLSNDLGIIPEFSWYEPIKTGYYPDLRYYNGVYFPSRENYYYMYTEYNYYYIQMVEMYEQRIMDAIDLGFFYMYDGTRVDLTKPESIEYLGNLFQSNPDSKNTRMYGYLELYAKMLLSASPEHFDTYKMIPGIMEQFETAMRDPLFYQLYKRFLNFYWQFKDHLPYYTYEEIFFPGVKIENIEVDKLVTYFDKFEADITNAVDIEVYDEKMPMSEMKKFGKIAHYQGEDFVIKASQYRLNHLPFTFKFDIVSDKAVKAFVKVFIGPKYDMYGNLYTINENRENFFELDSWIVDLKSGVNKIEHSSTDFSWFVKDRTTYYELYKNVMLALKGEFKFPLDMSEAHCGWPSRLMLPKGKKGGMPFQFFIYVTPYYAPKVEQFSTFDSTVSCGIGSGSRYKTGYAFGYPLDRKINEQYWFTPNMKYYDVMIFHKTDTEITGVY